MTNTFRTWCEQAIGKRRTQLAALESGNRAGRRGQGTALGWAEITDAEILRLTGGIADLEGFRGTGKT